MSTSASGRFFGFRRMTLTNRSVIVARARRIDAPEGGVDAVRENVIGWSRRDRPNVARDALADRGVAAPPRAAPSAASAARASSWRLRDDGVEGDDAGIAAPLRLERAAERDGRHDADMAVGDIDLLLGDRLAHGANAAAE